MKIFITGATGFIGNKVLNQLCLGSEHELICLVRKHSEASECLKNLGANLIIGDVTNKESILKGMKGCDWVIHVAGLYSFWESNTDRYKQVNIDGTRNVMECALETNISKIVHVSSAAVYGKPGDSPFTEKSKIGPVRFSKYAQTKYEGDQIVWELHEKKGLPVVVIYPAAVLGAGDPKASGRYVSDLVHKRLPATVFDKATLTWVHVNDVAEAIIKALEKPDNIGEKYFIGKHIMLLSDFNKMVSEISGAHLPVMHMPDFLSMAGAYFFTGISKLIKIQPPWGMSVDQMRMMKEGFVVDGSKAEKELELTYTPVSDAIEEEIAAHHN